MSDASDVVRLASHAASLDTRNVPSGPLTVARACLLYGLAVGMATIRAKPALIALAATPGCDNTGNAATRLIDGKLLPVTEAAFANAVLLSGRVQGDSHPCGHLGGVVIPAALASAERAGASGATLLAAMIAGYEVSLRIGRDHAADLSARGFRTTPCYGVFGAAAAAARAFGFDGTQTANAIRLAANFAGGLREHVDAGTEESPFHAGFAARNGLHVAELVRIGVTAAPNALHGQAGFYRAFGKKDVDYGTRLTAGLGEHYEFTTVTFKEYPACQFLRGMITGQAELRRQADGVAPELIEVRLHPFEADFIGVRYTGPFTSASQTVMSAPFCAALAWVSGTVGYDDLRNFTNDDVLRLIPRIRIVSDDSRKRYEPHLKARLADGRVLDWEQTAGDSGYRLTWEAALRMAGRLCEEARIPSTRLRELVAAVAGIEEEPGVAPLFRAVRNAIAAAASR